MKRLVITESEKQRILGMHQIAANKITLLEQSSNAKLNEILSANNNAAWQFINAVKAAEQGASLGTTDEEAIVKLVEGIDTVDKYIAILWNVRNNVEGNYCSVYGFATKQMLHDDSYFGIVDREDRARISNKLVESCSSAKKYYGERKQSVVNNRSVLEVGFFDELLNNQPGGCSSFEQSVGKGCKGDFTQKK